MCRMQQQQEPPAASYTHARKTHHLSTIVTPDPWSSPCGHAWTQRGTKAFHSFYPQNYAESGAERRIIIPPFNSTALKPSKLNFVFTLHPYDEEVLARKGLWENEAVPTAHDGDDNSLRKQTIKKERGVPLRELISCWIDLPGSMLTVPLLMTARDSKRRV